MEEEGYRTGPPGYIGWRNSFFGIDSGAPYTFKNTGWLDKSFVYIVQYLWNGETAEGGRWGMGGWGGGGGGIY